MATYSIGLCPGPGTLLEYYQAIDNDIGFAVFSKGEIALQQIKKLGIL